MMQNIWQIAAGETGRNYVDLFLNHDVMFLGPGDYGSYLEVPERYRQSVKDGEHTGQRIGAIRRFCHSVQPGDFVLLRFGYHVEAIGLVPDDGYRWDSALDDIYGWNLQHTRRVIWQRALSKELKKIQVKKGLFHDRKQIPMFTGVNDEKVLGPIRKLFKQCKTRPLKKLPSAPPPPLSLEEVGATLFREGLANDLVDKVIHSITRQRRMLKWYYEMDRESGRPTEHEVVAHMILPLLLSLGWSEQLLAVEWNRIDLAAFSSTPTTKNACVLVCEAKGLGYGLQHAAEQARTYVEKLKLSKCRRILVTDGGRLYLYEKSGEDWMDNPTGYLNIEKIRTNHLAPADTSAVDTIMKLTPAGISR
ncbi:MAG: hypothetical protein KJ626_13765 [Verrucomicrobia bacterium]|nr:hypothetical protein [Verrucomicrobiota bacterium]